MDAELQRPEQASIPDLVGQLGADVASLVRTETQLVRAEVSEKLRSIGKGVGDVAAGGILLTCALLVLLQALVLALSKVMDPLWASLVVGAGVALVGVVLVRLGMKVLSTERLKPDRSVRQLEKNAEIMKGSGT